MLADVEMSDHRMLVRVLPVSVREKRNAAHAVRVVIPHGKLPPNDLLLLHILLGRHGRVQNRLHQQIKGRHDPLRGDIDPVNGPIE